MHDLEAAVFTGDLAVAGSVEVGSAGEPCFTVADGAGADGGGAVAGSEPPGGDGAVAGGGAQVGDGVAQGGDGAAGDGAGTDLAAVGGGRMGSAGPRDQLGPTTATMAAGASAGTTEKSMLCPG